MCCIQPRYSWRVGRKSRDKRERRSEIAGMPQPAGLDGEPPFRSVEAAVATWTRPRRRKKRAPVGARVARVAVDDDTWAAFRELCGTTPASVRLAELVEADVQRARESTPESDAVDALKSIRAHADTLEAFIRDSGASS
jgi:hypothetical protein